MNNVPYNSEPESRFLPKTPINMCFFFCGAEKSIWYGRYEGNSITKVMNTLLGKIFLASHEFELEKSNE